MAVIPHEHRWIRCYYDAEFVLAIRCADCHMTPLEDLATHMTVDISAYLEADQFLKIGDPLRLRVGLPMEGIGRERR